MLLPHSPAHRTKRLNTASHRALEFCEGSASAAWNVTAAVASLGRRSRDFWPRFDEVCVEGLEPTLRSRCDRRQLVDRCSDTPTAIPEPLPCLRRLLLGRTTDSIRIRGSHLSLHSVETNARDRGYAGWTFSAHGPLGPRPSVKVTFCPSRRSLKCTPTRLDE